MLLPLLQGSVQQQLQRQHFPASAPPLRLLREVCSEGWEGLGHQLLRQPLPLGGSEGSGQLQRPSL